MSWRKGETDELGVGRLGGWDHEQGLGGWIEFEKLREGEVSSLAGEKGGWGPGGVGEGGRGHRR